MQPDIDQDQQRERARVDQLFADVFEADKRGAEVFDVLLRRFNGGALVQGGIDAVLTTYRNAGRREVLDYIVARCNRARGVPDIEPAQPEQEARTTL